MSAKWSDDTKFPDVSALDYFVGLVGGENAKCTRSALKESLSLAKGDVGLGNVDNTSDAFKETATATLTNKTINGALFDGFTLKEGSDTTYSIASSGGDIYAGAGNILGSGNLIHRTTKSGATVWIRAGDGSQNDLTIADGGDVAVRGALTVNGDLIAATINGSALGTAAFADTGDFDAAGAADAAQAAAESYADGLVTGLLDFKGSIDCSLNPNYPTALKGDAYYISGAGKIGGASGKSVEVGDVVIASIDTSGANEGSVGQNWFILEHNLVGAVVTGGALGTPASGTLTNCTGFPISGLTASTSTALGVGSIELGHASDTTISRVSAGRIAVEGVNVPTISSTDSLSNKTLVAPVLGTAASGDITACSGRLFAVGMALSDGTAATTGAKGAETIGIACKIVSIYLNAVTAPTGSSFIVDLKKNGTTIFSTKISIDAGETNSSTGTLYALSSSPTTFAAGDVLSYHVDQIGASVAGAFIVCDILLVTT